MVTVTLNIDGVETTLTAKEKTFSTGSTGFFLNGKAKGAGNDKYQVGGNIVLIGSKPKAA